MFRKIKFIRKVNIIFLILFAVNVIALCLGIHFSASEYAKTRMKDEFKEEARTMATVWKYRAGGGFTFKDGEYYTLNGERLEDIMVDWYNTWYTLKTSSAEMSILLNTKDGFKRICTSLTDKNENSIKDSYLDNEEVLAALKDKENREDYNGTVRINGKTYVVSYSFFYRADNKEVPFICALGEDVASIERTLMNTAKYYVITALLFVCIGLILAYIIVIRITDKEINRKVTELYID